MHEQKTLDREDDMSDIAPEIVRLKGQIQKTRYDFLQAELHTCAISLDMARLEFDRRNFPFAHRELQIASKGLGVIERFLPNLEENQQNEIRLKLRQLKSSLEALEQEFQGKSA